MSSEVRISGRIKIFDFIPSKLISYTNTVLCDSTHNRNNSLAYRYIYNRDTYYFNMAARNPWAGHILQKPHMHPIYRVTGTLLGASMWFFLMYRAKKDLPTLLGIKHPWDH